MCLLSQVASLWVIFKSSIGSNSNKEKTSSFHRSLINHNDHSRSYFITGAQPLVYLCLKYHVNRNEGQPVMVTVKVKALQIMTFICLRMYIIRDTFHEYS